MSVVDNFKNKQTKRNPLRIVWNIFCMVGGILSLSSIAENFTKWEGFIKQIIETYRQIVHPVFDFILGWIPIYIPLYIYDYFVIGLLIAASYIRALYSADSVTGYRFGLWPTDFYDENPFVIFAFVLLRIFFWPITLLIYLSKVLRRFDEGKTKEGWIEHFKKNDPFPNNTYEQSVTKMVRHDYALYIEGVSFFQWLGFLIFGILLLLIINEFL